ncbi:MAG: GAF domain-containing protein [Chloroflexi bacterium]|nr:GAF domain-containing protein [Chloroflexota bacterium]
MSDERDTRRDGASADQALIDQLGDVMSETLDVDSALPAALQAIAAAQGQGKELAALHKIAAALTSTLQLDEILTSTVEGIRHVLNVEAGSLLLLDEERGELIFKKTLSGEPDWIFQYSLKVGQGLVGECVRTGKPLLVNDAQTDPRFYPALDGVTGFHTRSVLCAPLIARGQTLGALEVINKRDGSFDLHDQELLVSMTAWRPTWPAPAWRGASRTPCWAAAVTKPSITAAKSALAAAWRKRCSAGRAPNAPTAAGTATASRWSGRSALTRSATKAARPCRRLSSPRT